MALIPIDKSFKERISPPPVHESIVVSNKATIAFIRYLNDLRASGRNIYDEVNRVIEQVNLNIEEINSLQVELDNTQEGAGLGEDGYYLVNALAKYISEATSLNNADVLLDTAIYDYTREYVNTVSISVGLTAVAQTVLVDATSGPINITLPPPVDCFDTGRSLRFGISKTDLTANIITILPNATELIVGEISQSINSEGDILNFITDGTNWYLQN